MRVIKIPLRASQKYADHPYISLKKRSSVNRGIRSSCVKNMPAYDQEGPQKTERGVHQSVLFLPCSLCPYRFSSLVLDLLTTIRLLALFVHYNPIMPSTFCCISEMSLGLSSLLSPCHVILGSLYPTSAGSY